MQIDKVYRKGSWDTVGFSADIAGGTRQIPISLPRVRWLEKDPNCAYELVSNISVHKTLAEEDPNVPVRKKVVRLNARPRVPAPRWTPEEDKIVWDAKDCKTPEEIAIKCGRSRKAVLQRIRILLANKRAEEKRNRRA